MSLTFGNNNIQVGKITDVASEQYTISIGTNSAATKNYAITIGNSSKSLGRYCISLGNSCYSGTNSAFNDIGHSSMCIGYMCGNSAATMNTGRNIAIGSYCLNTCTDCGNTISIGDHVMSNGIIAGNPICVGIGSYALFNMANIDVGLSNNAIGNEAGYNITSGRYNNLIGYRAGYNITISNYHVCLGHNTPGSSTGSYGTYIGYNCGSNDGTKDNQISVGYATNSDENSIAIGNFCTTGIYSIAVGNRAYCKNDAGTRFNYSLAVGSNARAEGNYNICIGGGFDGGGTGNGPRAQNTGAIVIAGQATLGTGLNSILIGTTASSSNISSIAVGKNATASGSNAIAIGGGCTASGTNAIAIGSNCTASGINSITIGNSLTAGDNIAAYGSTNNTSYHKFYVNSNSSNGREFFIRSNSVGGASVRLALNNGTTNNFSFWAAGAAGYGYNSSVVNDIGFRWTAGKSMYFQLGSTNLVKLSTTLDIPSGKYCLVNAGPWVVLSDRNQKTNIEDCRSMLDTCKSIPVRSFAMKKEPSVYFYGWVAQEVLSCLNEEEKTQFKIIGLDKDPDDGLEYYTLVGQQVLIMGFKATQELADIQDATKQRIDSLETSTTQFEQSLEHLKLKTNQLQNQLNTLLANISYANL